jgi:hypothetical protein
MLAKRAATIAAKKHGVMPSGGAGHASSTGHHPSLHVAFMSHTEHGGEDPDCPKLTGAKYVDRPGPPRAGNEAGCRGKQKRGNDEHLYESVPNKNGVYSWRKVKVV